jgi:hypothetical protein
LNFAVPDPGGSPVAKDKKPAKKFGGPFLAAAVFCEGIVEDQRKMVSALGVMDGVQFFVPSTAPADFPSKAKPATININALLTFRAGDGPRKHKLKVVGYRPDGSQMKPMMKFDLAFPDGLNAGVNIKTTVTLHVYSSGVFCFDVILDNKVVTRMPLIVSFQRPDVP